jgi:hypothetical protein
MKPTGLFAEGKKHQYSFQCLLCGKHFPCTILIHFSDYLGWEKVSSQNLRTKQSSVNLNTLFIILALKSSAARICVQSTWFQAHYLLVIVTFPLLYQNTQGNKLMKKKTFILGHVLEVPVQEQAVPLLWDSGKDGISWRKHMAEQSTFMMARKEGETEKEKERD